MSSQVISVNRSRSGSVYAERADVREGPFDRWARARWQTLESLRWGDTALKRCVRMAVDSASVFGAMPDAELAARLRASARRAWGELAKPGRSLADTLAAVRELSRRSLGMEPYPTQLLGAAGLLTGRLVEMQTGEGKSLTAALAATVAASAGVPVHVVTVNDYLAQRDAEEMAPLYRLVALSVGSIITGMSPEDRRLHYACDITYCTGKELVFDYLKDRSTFGANISEARFERRRWVEGTEAGQPLLRGLHFAIVDEADSIFIDEARTPLILAAKVGATAEEPHFRAALDLAARLTPELHYLIDPRHRLVQLTVLGRQFITQASLGLDGEWSVRVAREHWMTQALRAQHLFLKDHHYVVRDGKVEIVDENTGRVLPGRTWEQGLHQMIETKEGCEHSDRTQTLARITCQRFFARYLRLAGMTGTAQEVRREIRGAYRLRTLIVPTHRRCQRVRWRGGVCNNAQEKWHRIADRIETLVGEGRAVLAGTRSVQASEELSAILTSRGIAHKTLNAREDAAEAELVSGAGGAGVVTVATNMAGRGTDIKPASEVLARGGLHVLLSEHHESSRVDRQLFGRSARQGDPGSAESIVALDDTLFVQFAPSLTRLAVMTPEGALRHALTRFIKWHAQRRAESQHRKARAQAVRVDDQLTEMMSLSGRL
ncbi:MAG: hypothetical protein K2X42_03235 [Burkholderiaceae bacterium]|nr:hypothetical protein [Burkholderiaceae bacterium]